MPYSDKEYQTNNINYLNKDFSGFKSALIEYAKTYFPNSYRDFNETSPGMMLIEMSAYVGDVLSFYIDNQYKEMILPLAEERRNVINIANMLGYKVKPIHPAYVDIEVSQTVGSLGDGIDNISPDYSQAMTIDKGLKITSTDNSSIKFETLDVVDFTVSSSIESQNTPTISNSDSNGLPTEFTLTRTVRAISGETKTKTIPIGSPQKFKRITLSEENIIEIISVFDSSGNRWYEVDYLAQNKIPEEIHYTDESTRTSAYFNLDDSGDAQNVAVPYHLDFINVNKRFTVEINEDNTTSIVFGNGILNTSTSGSLISGYADTSQVGITIPGNEQTFNNNVSPLLGNYTLASLGEIPQNTNLIINYRVGGGINSNVPSGDLTSLNDGYVDLQNRNTVTPTVINRVPARGGQSQQSIDEIKRNTQANFISQQRCVTKEDYEARALSLPAKFGNIAKITANRHGGTLPDLANVGQNFDFDKLQGILSVLVNSLDGDGVPRLSDVDEDELSQYMDLNNDGSVNGNDVNIPIDLRNALEGLAGQNLNASGFPSDIEIHVLSYDMNKNLVDSPILLKDNLRNYLNQFRMITDEFSIYNGSVINFGVGFEVVAHKNANKHDVKLRCINRIIDYFNIDRMQFRQPIYTNDLIYEIMGIEGVRSVNFVELTQGDLVSNSTTLFDTELFNISIDPSSGVAAGSGTYGYFYNFNSFYDGTVSSDGVILPSVTPAVFELKNPNENIKGVVL